jgi:hypothetical protein
MISLMFMQSVDCLLTFSTIAALIHSEVFIRLDENKLRSAVGTVASKTRYSCSGRQISQSGIELHVTHYRQFLNTFSNICCVLAFAYVMEMSRLPSELNAYQIVSKTTADGWVGCRLVGVSHSCWYIESALTQSVKITFVPVYHNSEECTKLLAVSMNSEFLLSHLWIVSFTAAVIAFRWLNFSTKYVSLGDIFIIQNVIFLMGFT